MYASLYPEIILEVYLKMKKILYTENYFLFKELLRFSNNI